MLHIRPISEEKAKKEILDIYQDIKSAFHVSIVPLLFQYLANYEEYFAYVWEKIKTNVHTDYYTQSTKELIRFTKKALEEIYIPSRQMVTFTSQLHLVEKEEILDTVTKLEGLNAKLLLLTIGMREGLKGVQVEDRFLVQQTTEISRDFFETFSNIVAESTKKEAVASSRMLAPLFGSSALAFSHYADFFAHASSDMDELVTTEEYLTQRVMLEHDVLKKIEGLLPLGCSYIEVAKYAMGKPHFGELLYILTETFPSQFPRMLFASLLMQKAILYKPLGIEKV